MGSLALKQESKSGLLMVHRTGIEFQHKPQTLDSCSCKPNLLRCTATVHQGAQRPFTRAFSYSTHGPNLREQRSVFDACTEFISHKTEEKTDKRTDKTNMICSVRFSSFLITEKSERDKVLFPLLTPSFALRLAVTGVICLVC